MFDIGWSEMAVIALLAVIIIGPKDLPRAMQSMAKWVKKARSLTREFQSGIDDMVREADLEDARKAVQSSRNFSMEKTLQETVDPTGSMKDDLREVEETARRTESESAASKAEDLKAAEPDDSQEDNASSESAPAANEKIADDAKKEKVSEASG